MILKLIYYKKVIEYNFQKLLSVLHFSSKTMSYSSSSSFLSFSPSISLRVDKRILGLVDPRTSGICISFSPAGLVDPRTKKP